MRAVTGNFYLSDMHTQLHDWLRDELAQRIARALTETRQTTWDQFIVR